MCVKQKVTFELLQPVMCGGIRNTDNFLESESFIRGSVLRAGFAQRILLECPLADRVSKDGRHHFVELKDAEGICSDCVHQRECAAFSDMTFSFAYPEECIPAPLTAMQCKQCGTKHPIKDILVEEGALLCERCRQATNTAIPARMESLKGMLRFTENAAQSVKVDMVLSTHTAISSFSNTADEGSLYSVKAIRKGQRFTAEIDDCDTGMLKTGDIVYIGKFSSTGFGKMRIAALQPIVTADYEALRTRIEAFNQKFGEQNKVAVLFLSDAYPLQLENANRVMTKEEYLIYWTEALFGNQELPFSIEKIFTETQLYSGYDTAKDWGRWKQEKPDLMIAKGTSVLLGMKENRIEEAIALLLKLQETGVGRQTANGFGQIHICHPIHYIGRK